MLFVADLITLINIVVLYYYCGLRLIDDAHETSSTCAHRRRLKKTGGQSHVTCLVGVSTCPVLCYVRDVCYYYRRVAELWGRGIDITGYSENERSGHQSRLNEGEPDRALTPQIVGDCAAFD